jgi:MoxR-like ATPase
MQEGQVTVDEDTHPLPRPFIVMATQNPIEYEGTYPLPEAQLDRFILRASVGYPERSDEWEILKRRMERRVDEASLQEVVGGDRVVELQDVLEDVHVSQSIGLYIVDLIAATREHPDTEVGASPRGGLALLKLARANAFLRGRDFVIPDDVKKVAIPALAHRLTLRPHLWVRNRKGGDVVDEVLAQVPAPAAELEPEQI